MGRTPECRESGRNPPFELEVPLNKRWNYQEREYLGNERFISRLLKNSFFGGLPRVNRPTLIRTARAG